MLWKLSKRAIFRWHFLGMPPVPPAFLWQLFCRVSGTLGNDFDHTTSPGVTKTSYGSGLLAISVSAVQNESDNNDFEDVICFEIGLCHSFQSPSWGQIFKHVLGMSSSSVAMKKHNLFLVSHIIMGTHWHFCNLTVHIGLRNDIFTRSVTDSTGSSLFPKNQNHGASPVAAQ